MTFGMSTFDARTIESALAITKTPSSQEFLGTLLGRDYYVKKLEPKGILDTILYYFEILFEIRYAKLNGTNTLIHIGSLTDSFADSHCYNRISKECVKSLILNEGWATIQNNFLKKA